MATFYPKPGWVLVLPHTDEEKSSLGILFPDTRRRKRASGIVILHQVSEGWLQLEDPLDGLCIFFEKWTWKSIVLGGSELLLVPEGAIFACSEATEEDRMDRNALIAALHAHITQIVQDVIPENTKVTADDVDSIVGAMEYDPIESVVSEVFDASEGSEGSDA